MGLRRQLVLVGCLTFAFPWAGCQYVREMEATLRSGQAAALQATAQAVAARIAEDRNLIEPLQGLVQQLREDESSGALYVHTSPAAMVVDGYTDDWRAQGWLAQTFAPQFAGAVEAEWLAARWGKTLYIHVLVKDRERQFYDPSQPFNYSDHLQLQLKTAQQTRVFHVVSAAAGEVAVMVAQDNLPEHRISGVWSEEQNQYALELQLPLAWALEGITLEIIDGRWARGGDPVFEQNHWVNRSRSPMRALVTADASLQETLAVFTHSGVQLYVVAPGQWILAQSGGLQGAVEEASAATQTWRGWLIRQLIGQPDYPPRQDLSAYGQMQPGLLNSAREMPNHRWLSAQRTLIAQVAAPIGLPSKPSANADLFVVAEQTTDSIQALTSGAVGRLLWYSTLASAAVGLVLLGYASILSIRVRRLSRMAQMAVDRQGRIRGAFVASKAGDELGELSRNYALVLERLEGYTRYLESLAGKLSHELRTPLAIVRSSLDNLAFSELPTEAAVYADRASEGVARLSKILNAMSAATRIEQSIQTTEKETVDCKALLMAMGAAYQDLYPNRCIKTITPVDDRLEILGSAELLAQMLDKLVENAADFAGQAGHITLQLRAAGSEITFLVMNTGPALADGLAETIFDSLVSARPANTADHHLGLGLYIVRLIVLFHQGSVRAYNDEEQQAVVFEINLPRS